MQAMRDKQQQEKQLLYRDNEKLLRRVDELERKVQQTQNSWQSMPRQGSEHVRSRDHSPTRGSPQYAMGGPGSGGRQPPNRLPVSIQNKKERKNNIFGNEKIPKFVLSALRYFKIHKWLNI